MVAVSPQTRRLKNSGLRTGTGIKSSGFTYLKKTKQNFKNDF